MKKDFLGVGVSRDLEQVSYEKAIKESIKIVLLTRRGERVMRPDFGCGINDMVFNSIDAYTISVMKENIVKALGRWEPRIKNVEVEVRSKHGAEDPRFEIEVKYTLIETNSSANLVFPFYPEGAWS
ncbi:MAG: GPW/gp25 family protein [Bdellovibrionales bacterium]